MSWRLRTATEADIPALAALIPEAVRTLSVDRYTPEEIESGIRHAFGVDSQLIADGTYLVAQAGDRIAGCGGWSWRRKIYGGDAVAADTLAPLDPATDAARIRAFFVHPDFARRGIGSAILRACARAAADAGFRRLELLGTLPGEPLYRALGFEVIEYTAQVLPDGVRIRWVRMGRELARADADPLLAADGAPV